MYFEYKVSLIGIGITFKAPLFIFVFSSMYRTATHSYNIFMIFYYNIFMFSHKKHFIT